MSPVTFELLGKETLTDVEGRLLTALHWAGQAAANSAIKRDYQEKLDAEREQSFLFYAICLESLFCKRHETIDITERLSGRSARLLNTDVEKQELIRKRVKKLYARRSDIVHQGGLQVSKQELAVIRYYALALKSGHILQNGTKEEAVILSAAKNLL